MIAHMKHAGMIGLFAIASASLMLLAGPTSMGCEESMDNLDTRILCRDYCVKEYDCNDEDPSDDEFDDCVGACRNSIEDNCGNEHQADANDKIEECVDKSCVDFWACMVFDAAPECFGFVN